MDFLSVLQEGMTHYEFYYIPNHLFGLSWDLGLQQGRRDSELEEIISFTSYLSNVCVNLTNHDSCI